MNVLLATSAAPEYSPFPTKEKRFPIGVGFLISVLERAGHNVHFVDRFLWNDDYFAARWLERKNIEFVGIYSSTVCFADTLFQLERLQALREAGVWKGRIAVGGPHASICPETIPDYVDHVVVGEGEGVIVDIVEDRIRERIVRRATIADLDTLPPPAYRHFLAKPYNLRSDAFPDVPVFTMNTSRGCPFNCAFCSVKAVWHRSYRAFSAGRVVQDIEQLVTDFDVRGIYFREDNFTFSKERTIEFCELLLTKDLRIKWLCESRVHPMDEDMLRLMARSGCKWMYFGCESGSPRMLRQMQKGITVEQISRTIGLCHKFDIKPYTTWLVGLPGETEYDRKLTRDLIRTIQPFKVGVSLYVGLPGSEYCKQLRTGPDYLATDSVGLVYSRAHNRLATRYYGDSWKGYIYNGDDVLVGPLHGLTLWRLLGTWDRFRDMCSRTMWQIKRHYWRLLSRWRCSVQRVGETS